MKIIITGGGFANKGAEAMLLTTMSAMSKRLGNVEIFAHVADEDVCFAKESGLKVTKWFAGSGRSPLSRLGQLGVLHAYRTADAVLDVGGYQFGDVWGSSSAERKIKVLRNYLRRSAVHCYLPQAWGPFENEDVKIAVRDLLNRTDLAYARDFESLRWVEGIIHAADRAKVRLGTDVAWAFEGLSPKESRMIIAAETGEEFLQKPVLAVTPNYGMAFRAGDWRGGENDYVRRLGEIIRLIVEDGTANVLLVAHYFHDSKEDDRSLCDHLAKGLPEGTVGVIRKRLRAREVKGVIGCCAAILSSRYHALIAAMSQGIPAMALGWSHKYEELLQEIGDRDSIISISESNDSVMAKLIGAINERGDDRAMRARKAAELKARANSQFDEVAELFRR